MRLTTYTDYTLRVLMYLALHQKQEGYATIQAMSDAYGISKSHLTKIVHALGRAGYIETLRGRTGGLRLARPPEQISVAEVVKFAEPDFDLVTCHNPATAADCVIVGMCGLKPLLSRAVRAFFAELENVSLQDIVYDKPKSYRALGLVRPITQIR
jgi:Rrf2 family transcriptional regulator, nitric oxide-sensitive transcriptional repressor